MLESLVAALLAQAAISGPVFPAPGVVLSAPLTTSGHVPVCLAADSCKLQCLAGASGAWTCTNGAGASVAVTAGTSPTSEATPFVPTPGGTARWTLSNITDAKAPIITSGEASDAGITQTWVGNHTLVWVGHIVGTSELIAFSHGAYNLDGVYFGTNGATGARCNWNGDTDYYTLGVTAAAPGYWQVASCRKNGQSYTARVNGSSTTATDNITNKAPDRHVYFGRYSSAGFASAGPLALVQLWSRALTDAELARIEAQWWGVLAGSQTMTGTRATASWMCSDDGYCYGYQFGAPRIYPGLGLLSEGARTNYWTNSLSAGSWTAIATPVVTANTTAGPLSRYANGAEADTIEDNDGAADEGVRSATAGTSADQYVVSALIKAGTQTAARLVVTQAGGAGGGTCTFTGLDAFATAACTGAGCYVECVGKKRCNAAGAAAFAGDFVRAVCAPAAVTGSPTAVYGDMLIGDAAADTGTLIVSHAQIERGGAGGINATEPIVAGASATARNGDAVTAPSAGLMTKQGCVGSCFTPGWSTAFPSTGVGLVLSGNSGLTARMPDIAGNNTTRFLDGTNLAEMYPTLVAGTQKCWTGEWRKGGGSTSMRMREADGTSAGFTPFAGFSFDSTIGVGNQGGGYQPYGYISRVRFGRDAESCR